MSSFSSGVKEELCRHVPDKRHCRIAELTGVLLLSGHVVSDAGGNKRLEIHTENAAVARKYFTLLKKTYNINTEVSIQRNISFNKSRVCVLTVSNDEILKNILSECRLDIPATGQNMGTETAGEMVSDIFPEDGLVFKRDCCKRAFIRGAFLASGSVSDPVKAYHFEIVCQRESQAVILKDVMQHFEIGARIIRRKKYYVVYVKDSSMVADLLNIMGAYNALMNMENVRIVKDMRNQVNRKVNCETANISKTVSAAMKQIDDIRLIEESGNFDRLPQALQEVALLRLDYPEASLAELGEMLDTPVGKSGVNYRLKKISQFAGSLRCAQQ